jgi:hypothetical protein
MNSMSYSPTGVFATHSGPKIAAVASIVQTCRRLDVNLRDYLRDVLPKLGEWPSPGIAIGSRSGAPQWS